MEANIVLGIIAFIATTLAVGKHFSEKNDSDKGYCEFY